MANAVFFDVIERDPLEVEGLTGERLGDTAERPGLVEAPGTCFTPGVEDSHFEGRVLNRSEVSVLGDLVVFFGLMLDVVDELREFNCELKVTAVTDPVNELAEHGTANPHPVALTLADRVAAFLEGGLVHEVYRKEVGVQTQFLNQVALNVGNTANFTAVDAGTYDPVVTDFLEFRLVGLAADPVVAVEEDRLLAGSVNLLDAVFGELNQELMDELDPVEVGLGRHAVGGVEVTVVNDVIGREAVALLFFELVECLGGHAVEVAIPILVERFVLWVGDERELIRHGSKAHPVCVRMGFHPLLEEPGDVLACFGLSGVDAGLVRLVPVIRNVVVHRSGFPDLVNQEINDVDIPFSAVIDSYDTVGIVQVRSGNDFASGSIDDCSFE